MEKEEAWSYNEKRHCKNNIVASVGSHIYPLRCFQSKQSPFINEDFAVNLEAPPERRKGPTLTLLVSYLIAWSKHTFSQIPPSISVLVSENVVIGI